MSPPREAGADAIAASVEPTVHPLRVAGSSRFDPAVAVPPRLGPDAAPAPVTLLVAPAGFGKTTVVRAWSRQLGVPTATISFDEFSRCANAVDVGSSIIQGIEALGPSTTTDELRGLLRVDGFSLGGAFLRAVRQELTAIPGNSLLVMEDVHRLSDQLREQVGSLVRQTASDRHRIVVTSRTETGWPVQRWVMEGFGVVLTAEDLQLRPDEALRFLGPRFGRFAQQVTEFSGGWPAAVQMARWRLASGQAAPLTRAFQDTTEFVLAEIVPSLPEEDIKVLSRLSLLDPFPLSVGIAVTNDPATARVLQETMRRTALISPVGSDYFAMHATLREAFRQLLVLREPDRINELHLRAGAAWLTRPETTATLIRAVEHYVLGEGWDEAAEVLRHSWPMLESQSRMDLIARWLDEIPGRYWYGDPDLMPLAVSANLRLGRNVRAGRLIRLAPRHGGEFAKVRVNLASALTVGWNADPVRTEQFCLGSRDVLKQLDDEAAERGGLVFPGVASYSLAAQLSLVQATAMQGRFQEAIAGYREVLDHGEDVARSVMISVHGGLAWSLALTGEVAESMKNSAAALSLAAELGRRTHVRTIPALLAKAVAAFLSGDQKSVSPILEEVVRLGRAAGAQNLLNLADMAGVLSGLGTVSGERLAAGASTSVLPLAAQFIDARTLRDDALRGKVAAARTRIARTEPHELALGEWVESLLALDGRMAAAQWLRRRPEPTSPLAAILRLLCDATVATDAGDAAGLAEAAAQMADGLELRGVVNAAPRSLWRRHEVSRSAHPLLVEAARRALTVTDPTGGLTSRELELLGLMTTGLTISEIAEKLFVSVPTLKWHRANLYRKLGATSRPEALAKAADLGLLAG